MIEHWISRSYYVRRKRKKKMPGCNDATLLRRHRRRYHGGCVIAQCTSNSVRAAAYERGNLGITRVQTLKTNFTENTAIIAATGHYAIPLYMFRVGLFAAVITVMPRDLSTRIIFIYAFRNARNPFCFNDGEHVWFRWASIVPVLWSVWI